MSPSLISLIENYLNKLSPQSQGRFAPHGYGADDIRAFYGNPLNKPFIEYRDEMIAGYAILHMAYLPYEAKRYAAYGFTLDNRIDATLAPSVADDWQGRGVAAALMANVKAYAKGQGRRRIFLWGGVQADNARAIAFYRKHGFIELGHFEHNGDNIDMVLLS